MPCIACVLHETQNHNGPGRFTGWPTNVLYNWYGFSPLFEHLQNDVALFVDYLSPTLVQGSEAARLIIDSLKASLYEENAHYEKYRWIVDYWKMSCDEKMNREPVSDKNREKVKWATDVYSELKRL